MLQQSSLVEIQLQHDFERVSVQGRNGAELEQGRPVALVFLVCKPAVVEVDSRVDYEVDSRADYEVDSRVVVVDTRGVVEEDSRLELFQRCTVEEGPPCCFL